MIGIRGGLGRSPIRLNRAYYSKSIFLNQLGISPTFNLMQTYIGTFNKRNQTLQLIDNIKAFENVKRYFSIKDSMPQNPIARSVQPEGKQLRANVVLVLMESMSAKLMKRHGSKLDLTPNLDKLADESLIFDNFFSAGRHTCQGIYSVLFSYPSIFTRNSMDQLMPTYDSWPAVLKKNDYQTMFFVPHDSHYDNVASFALINGFNEIYSQDNYPSEAAVNCWGVPDKFIFSYALSTLNEKAKDKRPFFATILTVSNHPPYVIPDQFKDEQLRPEQQAVRYADDAIGEFMEQAKKETWYANTIFLFVADHGRITENVAQTEMPISYNHIPFIIHSPLVEQGKSDSPGGQIDIGPTLLGLLNLRYINNTFGIDLLKEKRPYMFFTSDDMIGCINDKSFYIYRLSDKKDILYNRDQWSFTPIKDPNTIHLDSLKEYSFSMYQATEQMIQQKKTSLQESQMSLPVN